MIDFLGALPVSPFQITIEMVIKWFLKKHSLTRIKRTGEEVAIIKLWKLRKQWTSVNCPGRLKKTETEASSGEKPHKYICTIELWKVQELEALDISGVRDVGEPKTKGLVKILHIL